MKVRIRFFASIKEQLQQSDAELELPDSANIEDLRRAIASAFPMIASQLTVVRFAVNHAFVPADHLLAPGSEVALIPPVSGG